MRACVGYHVVLISGSVLVQRVQQEFSKDSLFMHLRVQNEGTAERFLSLMCLPILSPTFQNVERILEVYLFIMFIPYLNFKMQSLLVSWMEMLPCTRAQGTCRCNSLQKGVFSLMYLATL